MKKCKIDRMLEEINNLNGDCQYPQVGHLRYANIAGDGRNHRTVYVIVNDLGGVAAAHNGVNPKETIKKLTAIRDYFLNN